MLNDFKTFIMRGNVLDLAVGVIIGGAFGAIVGSLVKDILMPLVGLALGGVQFENLFIVLNGKTYATLALAQEAGAPVMTYGLFLQAVVNFIIIAFVIFMIVRAANQRQQPAPAPAPAAPTTKECPHCLSTIPLKATRCAHCTAELKA